MAATAQGREDEKLRASEPVETGGPIGVPQRWQKRAPGVRLAPQEAQGPADMLAPHDEQNFPLASAPQLGHFLIGSFDEAETAMRESYTAVRLASVDDSWPDSNVAGETRATVRGDRPAPRFPRPSDQRGRCRAS